MIGRITIGDSTIVFDDSHKVHMVDDMMGTTSSFQAASETQVGELVMGFLDPEGPTEALCDAFPDMF